MLHLSDNYDVTYCGQPVAGDMDVTDALVEVCARPHALDACPRCMAVALRDLREDDMLLRRERAMEAGMLHGVTAYNDAMGW